MLLGKCKESFVDVEEQQSTSFFVESGGEFRLCRSTVDPHVLSIRGMRSNVKTFIAIL